MIEAPSAVPVERPAVTPVRVQQVPLHVQRCGGVQCPPGTCNHDDARIQRSTAGGPGPVTAPSSVTRVLATPGQALGQATQAGMRTRFGHDFSRVRVHTGAEADASARAIHAHAYTVGRHVVMTEGRYQPHTPSGLRLLAHELAHTMQQPHFSAGAPLAISSPSDPAEREAEQLATAPGTAGAATASGPVVQAHLRIGAADDAYEREAERFADVVTRQAAAPAPGAASSRDGTGRVMRLSQPGRDGTAAGLHMAPAAVRALLTAPGQPLDAATRRNFEPRFGRDFSKVRIHADSAAATSASRIGARAYTTGSHIAFGAGEYRPGTQAGKRLLAHELTHVVQQGQSGPGSRAPDLVQRAPTVSILDKDFVGPPAADQRRAAASCPIGCCGSRLGTLQAMPIFQHASRTAIVAAGSANSTGIGAALHFIAANQPMAPAGCHCDDFRIIQVLETTAPAAGRGGNSYVDNSGRNTPFYSDVFLGGRGEHPVPAGYPDAGERLSTTESIYDRPYRATADLPAAPLKWTAESCVACIRNAAPDRVLGCVTYGFTRTYDAAKAQFGPVTAAGPSCLARPPAHFLNTVKTDRTTSNYDFRPAPADNECTIGDFPSPRGDTRMA
jgi:hypothetical protein